MVGFKSNGHFIWFLLTYIVVIVSGELVTYKKKDVLQKGECYSNSCMACRRTESDWIELKGRIFGESDIQFAEVNADEEIRLAVIFAVGHLPAIYHIKDGVVRLYSGKYDVETLDEFLLEKKYTEKEPVSGLFNPFSIPMTLFSGVIFPYEYGLKCIEDMKLYKEYSHEQALLVVILCGIFAIVCCSLVMGFIMALVYNFIIFKPASSFSKVKNSVNESSSSFKNQKSTTEQNVRAREKKPSKVKSQRE